MIVNTKLISGFFEKIYDEAAFKKTTQLRLIEQLFAQDIGAHFVIRMQSKQPWILQIKRDLRGPFKDRDTYYIKFSKTSDTQITITYHDTPKCEKSDPYPINIIEKTMAGIELRKKISTNAHDQAFWRDLMSRLNTGETEVLHSLILESRKPRIMGKERDLRSHFQQGEKIYVRVEKVEDNVMVLRYYADAECEGQPRASDTLVALGDALEISAIRTYTPRKKLQSKQNEIPNRSIEQERTAVIDMEKVEARLRVWIRKVYLSKLSSTVEDGLSNENELFNIGFCRIKDVLKTADHPMTVAYLVKAGEWAIKNHARNVRKHNREQSLDAPREDTEQTMHDIIPDKRDEGILGVLINAEMRQAIEKYIATITDPTQRTIFESWLYSKAKQRELAETAGLSPSRISRIINKHIKKLTGVLRTRELI